MNRLLASIALFLATLPALAGNIAANGYAWSENAGWINMAPNQGPGVTVTDTAVTGFAWGENIGWINFGPFTQSVANDGFGHLSGFAWSENAGWINFSTPSSQVNIDPLTGIFSGYAWSENLGWINFTINDKAVTSWRVDVNADPDNDGIPNGVELQQGTNPTVKDNNIFANTTPSYTLFVKQQYRDFLGREADAGQQYWIDQLSGSQQTRAQVIQGFFQSAEFAGTVAPVVRLYFAYFLRYPDYGGLLYHVGRSRAGTPLATISQDFATSQEFIDRYGALDDDHFVEQLYLNVLGRPSDPGGKQGWLLYLSQGHTRGEVMLGFSESDEFKGAIANEVFATMMYVGMLRRAPDSVGFQYWVGQLDGGTSPLAMTDGFLVSQEYHDRFLP